jgi:hypothetical protein
MLTRVHEIALHQILEMPLAPLVNRLVGSDGLVVEQRNVATSIRQAKQALSDYLAQYVLADADLEVVLKRYLDKWIALGTDVTTIDSGSLGNLSGLNDDPERERLEIRRQVLVIVPFYRHHEELLRAAKNCSTVSILR